MPDSNRRNVLEPTTFIEESVTDTAGVGEKKVGHHPKPND